MPQFPDASIEASKIVEDPTRLDRLDAAYVLLRDTSMMGTYTNLMDAINILAERGWDVHTMIRNESGMVQVLMRNLHFKLKNEAINE